MLGHLRSIPLLLVLMGVASSAGCGSDQIQGCAVGGNVTLNGSPLPDGTIMFRPQHSAPGLHTVSAEIANGKFSVPASHAIMPGSYLVLVTADKPTGEKIRSVDGGSDYIDVVDQYLPPKYNASTTLSAEITGDTTDLKFALQIP
jgi:hypothetical protein